MDDFITVLEKLKSELMSIIQKLPSDGAKLTDDRITRWKKRAVTIISEFSDKIAVELDDVSGKSLVGDYEGNIRRQAEALNSWLISLIEDIRAHPEHYVTQKNTIETKESKKILPRNRKSKVPNPKGLCSIRAK